MVKQLSDNVAAYLSYQLNYDEDKKAVLSFGLEIIIGEFLKIGSILVISLLIGTFSYTLIGLISFCFHRTFIGGAHERTFMKCLVISVLLLLSIGILGKAFGVFMQEHIWLALLVYGQAVILIYLWVPAGTEKKEIKNVKIRKKIKRTSLVISTCWMLLVVYSYMNQFYHQYVLASTLGVFSAFFFVTPLAYKIAKSKFKLIRG